MANITKSSAEALRKVVHTPRPLIIHKATPIFRGGGTTDPYKYGVLTSAISYPNSLASAEVQLVTYDYSTRDYTATSDDPITLSSLAPTWDNVLRNIVLGTYTLHDGMTIPTTAVLRLDKTDPTKLAEKIWLEKIPVSSTEYRPRLHFTFFTVIGTYVAY